MCTVEFILFCSVCCSECSSLVGSRDPPDAVSSVSVSGWRLIHKNQEAVDEKVGALYISNWSIDGSADGLYYCAGFGCLGATSSLFYGERCVGQGKIYSTHIKLC